MIEFLDVVDAEDRFIRTEERGQVHRLKLMHRAVHIFLFDHENRIYLQRRSWSKDQHPGLWDSSASGHVESGESYPDAARRELREELGLELSLEPVLKLPAAGDSGWEHSFLYVGRMSEKGPLPQPDPGEIIAGRFAGQEELDRELGLDPAHFSPPFRLLYSTYRKRTQSREAR